MGPAVDAEMIEYSSASSAVLPMAWAVVGPMSPGRSVVRPDSLSLLLMLYAVIHPIRRASRGSSNGHRLGDQPLPSAPIILPGGEDLQVVNCIFSYFHTQSLLERLGLEI